MPRRSKQVNWFPDDFSEQIFNTKYREYVPDIYTYFRNLASMVAQGNRKLADRFFRLMWEKKFSPGGRILAFGGRPMARLSLMNCTTHEVTGDSLEAISETVYTIMRSSSRGQGIGINLSKLRPAGSPVNNAAKTSTGAISFMEMFSSVGATIGQEGRRAAMLFSISDHHPDLYRPDESTVVCPVCQGAGCPACKDGRIPYDFLHVKKIPGRVENANISVMVSDDFMRAVDNDEQWLLYFRGETGGDEFRQDNLYPAREIFMALSRSARASAEPGILYWDTSKRLSNSDIFGERWQIVGTNACSEEVLDQDGVCNLGSMNLAAYVRDPFSGNATFDYDGFSQDVDLAIEFLDNVVELEIQRGNYVNITQLESLMALRRVGLGVMGLADLLAMTGHPYAATKDTTVFLDQVFSTLKNAAYLASSRLAREKGPALVWDRSEASSIVLNGFYSTLSGYVMVNILRYGLRNATVLSLAPTGTISNFFGVSSSIEPLFAHSFIRRIRMNGHDEFVDYVHPGVHLARSMGIPDSIYQTAHDVSPNDHILVQAIIQQHIDASIAKTVNMPAGTTDADVADIYRKAWRLGLKGLAIYVDGSRTQQVLYSEPEKEFCPECGGELVKEEGCIHCPACGWGKCSL
jgi:ribonucleoside-diphosphate reductase alpha chain